MNILDFAIEHFPSELELKRNRDAESRRMCASAFTPKISNQQFNNWVCEGREVVELACGDWMLTNKYTKTVRVPYEEL